jgi:hypothetical protein
MSSQGWWALANVAFSRYLRAWPSKFCGAHKPGALAQSNIAWGNPALLQRAGSTVGLTFPRDADLTPNGTLLAVIAAEGTATGVTANIQVVLLVRGAECSRTD